MGSWLPWGLQWAPGCLGRRPGRSPGGGVTSARPGRLGPTAAPRGFYLGRWGSLGRGGRAR